MIAPVRLRLSRARGFDLQAHSRATNGLPAVNVARPTRWGNPFRADSYGAALAASEFEAAIQHAPHRLDFAAVEVAQLRGKNLACWCRSGAPCHADVLLRLANAPLRCEAA